MMSLKTMTTLKQTIERLTGSLLSVIYPRTCPVCGRVMVEGERSMCLLCQVNLPVTDFHLHPDFNSIHERTMCHVPMERATAFFFYDKESPYTRLIHRAKYLGLPIEARRMARDYSTRIAPTGFFDGMDLIQPVPLSLGRMISRGYNQSHWIALGVADATGLPVGNLLRAAGHPSQTRMGASARLLNARGVYSVRTAALHLRPAHVLLVDDIVTTGATLTACADALRGAFPDIRVSVLTLASARIL